jgi:hypothetical protein
MILLEGFDGLVVLASVAAPLVAAFAGVSFAAITVGGIVTIVAAILAMAAVWVSNALIIAQMRTYWLTNQSAILCQLYDSGDAATALSALGSAVEDMLQAIEWGTILGPVSGPLSLALGGAIGAVETNSLINPLFKLVTGVALVGVECPCQEVPGNRYWKFDEDAEGWAWAIDTSGGMSWEHGWENPGHFSAEGNQSPGLLQDRSIGNGAFSQARWTYTFPALYRPTVVAGASLSARCLSDQATCWVEIHYVDDSYDGGGYAHPSGWSTFTATVSAPNVGKDIAWVGFLHNLGSHSGDRYTAVDDVRLILEP